MALLGAGAGGAARRHASAGRSASTRAATSINTAGLVVDRLGIAFDRLAGRAGERRRPGRGGLRRIGLRRALPSRDARRDRRLRRELLRVRRGRRRRLARAHGGLELRSTCPRASPTTTARRPRARPRRPSTSSSAATGCGCWPRTPPAGQLARWGWAMALYDLAYVAVRRRHRPHARAAARPPRRAARVAPLPPRGRRRPPPRRRSPPRPGPLGAWRQRAAYREGAR